MIALWLGGHPGWAQQVDPDSIAALAVAETDWDAAYTIARDADDVTWDLLTWLRLTAGAADFRAYQSFVITHPNWPALPRLYAASEQAIAADTAPDIIIAWFAEMPPQTAAGVLRLVRAHQAIGEDDQALRVLRDAWGHLRLTADGQQDLLVAFGDMLAPFHVARTDALLWRSDLAAARRMLPLLPDDQRALALARIGYLSRTADMQPLAAAVPPALQDDAGLAHARFVWLSRRIERDAAIALLQARSGSATALVDPARWASWRRVLARWAMREGRATEAYALASRHYLTEGASYADLEWLSGYLSLTYLGDPARALAHFENALSVSRTPISLARMHYWIGRSHDITGDSTAATAAYSAAAAHQTAFYGLLATEKLGLPLDPALVGRDVAWRDASVFADEQVQAAFILLAAGRRGTAVTFFAALARTLDRTALAKIGAYLLEIDEPHYALLLGKTAAARGIIIPTLYFPLHDMAQMDLPVAPEISLSIARRESEFNIGIGSAAGALGLMQLMPATAQEVATNLNLPYARGRLTSDWRYNATLGAAYLAFLEDAFGPTPVMIAAAYNAGPSRPRAWIDARGDPRLQEVDVVDWIEHIPFRETRNYVMRVTESIPIYRARLTGQTGARVAFTDLLIGVKPLLRPRARPVGE